MASLALHEQIFDRTCGQILGAPVPQVVEQCVAVPVPQNLKEIVGVVSFGSTWDLFFREDLCTDYASLRQRVNELLVASFFCCASASGVERNRWGC